MSEHQKCSKETGFCKILGSRVQPVGSNCKGFVAFQTLNLENGKVRLIGAAYKETANDRGVMMNTCPWCGESIAWFK